MRAYDERRSELSGRTDGIAVIEVLVVASLLAILAGLAIDGAAIFAQLR